MDYTYYGYSSSSYLNEADSLTSFTGVLLTLLTTYLIFILIILILQIIAFWKVFTKAGEKGWKSLIPIYNVVVLFKISGLSPWLVLVYLVGIIPIIGTIACLALTIYQNYCLTKSFGKSGEFTIGLVLLPTIFYMILGFGKAEYIGKAKEVKEDVQ